MTGRLVRSLLVTALCCLILLGVLRYLWVSPAGIASFESEMTWRWPDAKTFGGFSGVEVLDDGRTLVALSDTGWFYWGSMVRTADGRLGSIVDTRPMRIFSDVGNPADEMHTDAEGLVAVQGLGLYFSTERFPQIYFIPEGWDQDIWIETSGAFEHLEANKGLESLAIDAAGRLYAIPENGAEDGSYPLYRQDGETFRVVLDLPGDARYHPVEADFGPDGRLYVLERRFFPLFGFSTRLRRFTISGDGIVAEETLLRTRFGRHGNLEGLSVWRDAGGTLRFTMISDNDFWWFRPTTIVEYSLPASASE